VERATSDVLSPPVVGVVVVGSVLSVGAAVVVVGVVEVVTVVTSVVVVSPEPVVVVGPSLTLAAATPTPVRPQATTTAATIRERCIITAPQRWPSEFTSTVDRQGHRLF
jgi:hypothetical protein